MSEQADPISAFGTQSELSGVQMLRGVAAIAVLTHHALEVSNGAKTAFSPDWLTTSGASGVDIFFVISGFIMLYTSFRQSRAPLSPRSFLIRRAIRIYPLYWFCCLIMLSIMAVGFMKNHQVSASQAALSLALLPSSQSIIDVSWTLVYEVYFYAIFGTFLLLGSRTLSVMASTVAIAAFGFLGSSLEESAVRDFLTNPIPWEFVFGLCLALAFHHYRSNWRIRFSPFWAVPGFAVLAFAPFYVLHDGTAGLDGWPRVLAWGLPATLIVAASLSIGQSRDVISRLAVFLGDASYTIYLTHIFVLFGYGLALRSTLVSEAPQLILVPIFVVLAILVGVATHVLIEKPILALFRTKIARA